MEIALLDGTVLEGDLREERVAGAHHAGALHLGADTFGIDLRAAVERHVDPRNGDLALCIHRDLHDRGDVSDKTIVRGDAASVTGGKPPAPAGLLRDGIDHLAQSAGVERIALGRLGVIPRVVHRPRIDAPRGADQLEQIVLRVATRRRGELGDERLDRERVRNVRH